MPPLQRLLAVLGLFGLLIGAGWVASAWRQRQLPVATSRTTPPVTLSKARQQDIWRAEHTTFQIEHRFGPVFLRALATGDAGLIAASLTREFEGQTLGTPAEVRRDHAGIREERLSREASPSTPTVSGQVIAESLLAAHGRVSSPSRSSLRVLAIRPTPATNVSWIARILITSVGARDDGQLALVQSEHEISGIVLDGKRLGDVPWINRWTFETLTTRVGRQHLFEEATTACHLDQLPIPDNWNLAPSSVKQNRFQWAVADFNRDGRLDVAIAALGVPPLLLEGTAGGTFQPAGQRTGLVTGSVRDRLENMAAAWIDFDNDSWPDLVLGDRVYRNQEGKSFQDVTQRSGLGFLPECMGCLVADYDCDGRLDLYVLYQKRLGAQPTGKEQWIDETGSGLANQLWHNEGHGRFRNVTTESHAGGGDRHTHAASWFFYDDDHFPDLYLANDFGRNVVLRNLGDGSFEDISDATAANGFATSMGVATGDLDNDGQTDVYVANMYSKMGRRIIGLVGEDDYPEGVYRQIQGSCAGNRLYHRATTTAFQELSAEAGVNGVGWAYAPVLADFDADGRLDIYATTGFLSFDRKKPDG